jgi:predicted acyl esterase
VVYEYPGTTAIPAGTTVAGYLNPTTLSMSQRASGGASDVYVGTPAERLVSFDACTSQSSLTSCPGTQAVIAAVVLYFDTDANGVPGLTGYNSTIESWVVNSANG